MMTGNDAKLNVERNLKLNARLNALHGRHGWNSTADLSVFSDNEQTTEDLFTV